MRVLCRRWGSTVREKEKKGMKRILALSMAMLAVLLYTGCAGENDADSHMEGTQQMESSASETPGVDSDDTESAQNEPETDGAEQMPLLAEKTLIMLFSVVMEFITWDLTKLRNVQDWLGQSIIFPTM